MHGLHKAPPSFRNSFFDYGSIYHIATILSSVRFPDTFDGLTPTTQPHIYITRVIYDSPDCIATEVFVGFCEVAFLHDYLGEGAVAIVHLDDIHLTTLLQSSKRAGYLQRPACNRSKQSEFLHTSFVLALHLLRASGDAGQSQPP